jgi:predicted XRE-type DNA-binding protein
MDDLNRPQEGEVLPTEALETSNVGNESESTVPSLSESDALATESAVPAALEVVEDPTPEVEDPAPAVETSLLERSGETETTDVLEALELPSYADWETEALLVEAKTVLSTRSLEELRSVWPALRSVLDLRFSEARQHALEAFTAEGGVAMDFHYESADFLRWKDLSQQYRNKRAAWKQEEDQRLNANLKTKEELLLQIKHLAEQPDLPTAKTYTEFRAIQERWKQVGAVPSEQANTLYPTYRFFVDRFYDQLRLSNELRELDYKHNRETKEALIGQAEAVLEDALKNDAVRRLQALHAAWKETGPVEPVQKEPLWERFKKATDAVHDVRRAASEHIHQANDEKMAVKTALVEELEAWAAALTAASASGWNTLFEELMARRLVLQGAGHTFGDASEALWKRFRAVEQNLSRARNAFFKERKAAFAGAVAAKMALIEQAEALRDSADLKGTANTLKRLQADWKKTPFVPKGEGDKLWERFRAACNAFFDRAKSAQNEQDASLEENAVLKRALFDEAQGLTVSGREHLPVLLDLSKRWKAAGSLPAKDRKLDASFHDLMDKHFNALDMNKAESTKIRYQQKLEAIGGDGKAGLEREVQFLRTRLDEARRAAGQMEANFAMFSTGKSSKPNPFLVEAQKRLDAAKEEVVQWEQKLKSARTALQAHE